MALCLVVVTAPIEVGGANNNNNNNNNNGRCIAQGKSVLGRYEVRLFITPQNFK